MHDEVIWKYGQQPPSMVSREGSSSFLRSVWVLPVTLQYRHFSKAGGHHRDETPCTECVLWPWKRIKYNIHKWYPQYSALTYSQRQSFLVHPAPPAWPISHSHGWYCSLASFYIRIGCPQRHFGLAINDITNNLPFDTYCSIWWFTHILCFPPPPASMLLSATYNYHLI